MKTPFLNGKKPPIVAMIGGETAAQMKKTIATALADGADALGIQVEQLPPEERTDAILTDLFAACGDHPIYVTSYRGGNSETLSDEQITDYLLQCLSCGATLGDVMGDLYCPAPTGMTFDPTAAQRQTELIRQIHAMGKEVLISVHTHTFLPPEELLRYAQAQAERGTDIVKIVNFAEDEEQLVENLKTVKLFREKLQKPFLLLANKAECRPLRLAGPDRGVCMYLCRTVPAGEQPLVKTVKYWRDEA